MSEIVVYGQPAKDRAAVQFAGRIHDFMAQLVLRVPARSALEIGSGEGVVGAKVGDNFERYVGIEPDVYSISQARTNFPKLHFVHASSADDAQRLGLGKFDLVFSNDVIEHVYEPRRFVEFAKAHLNPRGCLILGTPDYGNYLRNLAISLTNRWDKHHTALWDGGHIKFFSQKTLSKLLNESGFIVERWEKLGRLPILSSSIFAVARLSS